MTEKAIDLTVILTKLDEAKLVNISKTSLSGVYSIKEHGHLLEPRERMIWHAAMHGGMKDVYEECTDLHRWKIEIRKEEDAVQNQ